MSDQEESDMEKIAREHAVVRQGRTGDPERGMHMGPRVHPTAEAHAPASHYADPRPRPSIAYDPLKDEPEIVVDQIEDGDPQFSDDENDAT